MKKMLVVQHADGTRERICPKCNQVMKFHPGGVVESFGAGEYIQREGSNVWYCESCHLVIDEEDERKELQEKETWLIDLILDDGERDGLFSMAEHPRYQELIDLQEQIEVIEKLEGTAIHTPTIAEKVPQWAKSLEKA